MSRAVPKYRRHPNGQAFVQHKSIPRRDHRLFLGKYGSEKSRRRYQQFLARLSSADPAATHLPVGHDRTITELVAAYLEFAERYYSKGGKPTKEFVCMKEALRPVAELFGDEPGTSFGPRSLSAIQQHLIRRQYARKVINHRISRIKRFVKWCCQQELLPWDLHHGLSCVGGLRRGHCDAKEPPPVSPVRREEVEAVLPFLAPQVATMIQVQYLCGMRPGEVTIMRRCDIDTSGDIWLYRPHDHKGEWREQTLIKAVPRAAQKLILPFFKPDIEAYLFSPREAEAWRKEHRPIYYRSHRKTPIYPSELKAREKAKLARRKRKPKRPKRDHYDTDSYRRAIFYGFKKAEQAGVKIRRWCPNQLRHGIATEVSQILGQQAAGRWLGHASLKTTDIYVEKQVAELIMIARELDRRWAS